MVPFSNNPTSTFIRTKNSGFLPTTLLTRTEPTDRLRERELAAQVSPCTETMSLLSSTIFDTSLESAAELLVARATTKAKCSSLVHEFFEQLAPSHRARALLATPTTQRDGARHRGAEHLP